MTVRLVGAGWWNWIVGDRKGRPYKMQFVAWITYNIVGDGFPVPKPADYGFAHIDGQSYMVPPGRGTRPLQFQNLRNRKTGTASRPGAFILL